MRRAALLLVGFTACTISEKPPPQPGGPDVRATIKALDTSAQRWMANNAIDSLVNGYYASDAVVMNPNSPPSVGTEAIRSSWTEMSKTALVRLQFKVDRIIVADSVATTQGTYTFQLRPKPPADTTNFIVSDRGSYVTTFVRREGNWRAVLDIATSSVPLPAPAVAPKK